MSDMATPAGDRALEKVMRQAARMPKAGRSREAVLRAILSGFAAVDRTHGEGRTLCSASSIATASPPWPSPPWPPSACLTLPAGGPRGRCGSGRRVWRKCA